MPRKIMNIEIPVCNRDNVFNTCFLPGLKFLAQIKDWVDITILYNGNHINDKFVQESNNAIKELGFDLFYKVKEGKVGDIVQLRNEVHQINPNQRPLILQLDDDIQITTEDYVNKLFAAAQFMIENSKAGVVCFQSSLNGTKMDRIVPIRDEQARLYTSGGLLLKNIEDWNGSLYPPDANNLSGCWSDILVSFVRAREGLGVFIVYTLGYRHYEIRKETRRPSGFTAHKWGDYMTSGNSSVSWLKKQGVGYSGGFSTKLIASLWRPAAEVKIKNNAIEEMDYSKLLSIEIPSCNRQDALFKYFLPSLHLLKDIKDKVVICLNYNGSITDDQIQKANKIIDDLGFELYWTRNIYSFDKGKVPTVQFREDAHALYPNAKYCLLLDDDISFNSEYYSNQLLKAIQKMEEDESIGGVSFTKNKRGETYPNDTYKLLPPKTHAWMDGGVLLRNIKSWNGLFPIKLRKLFGTGEDRLCLTVRHQIGLKTYLLYSECVSHWEHHDRNFVPGRQIYGWDRTEMIPGSILYYYKNILNYQGRWVYDVERSAEQKNMKRILNIELPVCDRKVFFQRLFPSLRYLKPLAPYCYFLINYQKTFTKTSMDMIDRYLKSLGFEVISTFNEYDFNSTNHSIMKIRNDTHMLKPDTPFILSIDSDMKILNENYCTEILNALALMIEHEDIGVAGLETHSYHWPSTMPIPQNYETEFVYGGMHHHAYATDCGLLLRNIFDNGLVSKDLQEKIGGLQDVLVVFERFKRGYKTCCKKTNNASVLKDYENERGRAIYGWASDEVMSNPDSIWQYLKPFYNKQNITQRIRSDIFPGEPYWENKTIQNFIFDINKLNTFIAQNIGGKENES